jgi:putative acetyltransferase
VKILLTATETDMESVRTLFREYAAALPFDLRFQGFAHELSSLPGKYAGPRGRLLLAVSEGGLPAGCVGLRPLGEGIAEMKRLFVRPEFRGRGTGKRLVLAVLDEARSIGYRRICLDTIAGCMDEANRLYDALGFHETAAYYDNPLPNVRFLEKILER